MSGTVRSPGLRAVLNFCLSSWTYSENTKKQTKRATIRSTKPATHLWIVWIFGFLLLQHSHQRFVLVHLGQTDPEAHEAVNKNCGFVCRSVCLYQADQHLPVVQERLRVFEDVSSTTSDGDGCFIHRHLKLSVEQVSHPAVRYEGPF